MSSPAVERIRISHPSGRRKARQARQTAAAAGQKPGAVIVVGNYRPALTAIRSLAVRGHRMILLGESGSLCAEFSRYLDDYVALPADRPLAQTLPETLLGLLDGNADIRAIMPIAEETIDAVNGMRDALEPRVRLAIPQAEVVALCHDKYRWLQFIDGLGLSCPAYAAVYGLDELVAACEQIGYPVVARPIESGSRIGARKAITLTGPDDLARFVPVWPEGLNGLLLQRRVEGIRHNIFFAAAHGKIVREQYSLSFRTDRFDGSGSTTASRTMAPIESMSRELAVAVDALGYHGIGCAQFLGDAEVGARCFLEINPRFGATYVVAEHAGMELTRLTYELSNPEATCDWAWGWRPDVGTEAIWVTGDLQGILYSIMHREIGVIDAARWLGRTLAGAVTAHVHSTWSWKDPLPVMAVIAHRIVPWRKWFPRRSDAIALAPFSGEPGT